MYLLGISAFYHDSAAALLKDGRVLAAAEEERFSRVKHDNGFPFRAIAFCLREAGLSIARVNLVAYYEKPLRKFERILETFVATYPRSWRPFLSSLPEWLGRKIQVEHIIRKEMGYEGVVWFIPHHLSHAAATFYPSPFEEAAILTVDGVGEHQTAGLWMGRGTEIEPLAAIRFPHSLGLFYSTVTAFLGFRVNDDEYKVMGLAAYGTPSYLQELSRTIAVGEDGGFRLNLEYFAFRETFRMWSDKFEKLFGKPRQSGEPITERDRNLAASVQKLTEEVYMRMLTRLQRITNAENVCIGGGVALNALANGKLFWHTPFRRAYVFGPAGDSGAAIGAALYAHHALFRQKQRRPIELLSFGSSYDEAAIQSAIRLQRLAAKPCATDRDLVDQVAKRLAKNEIVGWFEGRMEFGPRALGNRSILANPAPKNMQHVVNRVKGRESFRPFAGSILEERVHEYFAVPHQRHSSPFMNFCFEVKPGKRRELAAITHADHTCRIQTVAPRHGLFYQLIKRFERLTGTPCILNTSFNRKGEPIVESPEQAIADFLSAPMHCLAIGKFIVEKPPHRG